MRIFRVFPVLAALCLFVPVVSLSAQTRVLQQITFTGAPGYSQSELLAFTGLKPGGSATQQQIEDAAQRLNDTGLFDEVNFTGNDKGIVYTLKAAPSTAMLPARFGNFVWWQHDEINRTLKARVAFYQADAVPTSGNMRASICSTLMAMLAEKGLPNASVGSVLSSSRPRIPPDRVAFMVTAPMVLIHSLTLADASPGMQPKLERVIQDVTGQEWVEDESYVNIAGRVGDVYRDEGYLDIAVTKPSHATPVMAPNKIELDVTASLSEGAQYHVTQLAWAGSEFLSTADFNKQAKLKPGDHDSPAALRESLKSLTNAYGAKGYLDAKILAPLSIDRVAHQVSYSISVVPGSQYRLKSVRWVGLSDAEASGLDSAWRIKLGDIYDSTYPFKFVTQNNSLLRQGYKVSFGEKRDAQALTVDLTVTFAKGAPQQK